jgi:DivIVA domain-containing protein
MPRVDLILLLVAVLLVGVSAAVAVGRVRGGLDEPVRSKRDNALPAGRLGEADISRARFTVALRGYRMDEVDAALDRIQAELRERDAELAALRGALAQETPRRGPAAGSEDGPDAGFGPGR